MLDSNTNQLVVSFGATTGPTLLGDSWILDLETNKWTCLHGADAICLGPSVLPPSRPWTTRLHERRVRGNVQGTTTPKPEPRTPERILTCLLALEQFVFGGIKTLECRSVNNERSFAPDSTNDMSSPQSTVP